MNLSRQELSQLCDWFQALSCTCPSWLIETGYDKLGQKLTNALRNTDNIVEPTELW